MKEQYISKYPLLVKVLTGIVGIVACYYAYYAILAIVQGDTIKLRINWNMFDSSMLTPLLIIGFLLGLGQKVGVFKPVFKNEKTGEITDNHDIVENMTASILMPLLMYLVFIPVMIAAMIYYPVMVIIHLFGLLFNFLWLLVLLSSIFFAYNWLNWSSSFTKTSARILRLVSVINIFIWYYWIVSYFLNPAWSTYFTIYIVLGALVLGVAAIGTLEYLISSNNETHDYAQDEVKLSPFLVKLNIASAVLVLVMALFSYF